MITKLNLASQPFRNRTLPYLISLLFLALAVAGAVLSFAGWRDAASRSDIAKAEIEQMNTELQALKGKGALVQQSLTPEQQTF